MLFLSHRFRQNKEPKLSKTKFIQFFFMFFDVISIDYFTIAFIPFIS